MTSTFSRSKIQQAKEELDQIITHGRGSFRNADDMIASFRKHALRAKELLEEAEQDY